MTQITTRRHAPFDALIAFHMFATVGDLEAARHLVDQQIDQAGFATGQVFSATTDNGAVRVHGLPLDATDTDILLRAWNAPDGDIAFRCFMPNHGIATLVDGRLDWMTAICFQCANARHTGIAATSTATRMLDDKTGLQSRLVRVLPDREFPILGA